jgi:Fe(3+) dicitrate transport protein
LGDKVTFDASIRFVYNDKIGEYETRNPNGSAAVVRYRSNIGTAVTYGFETMFDWNLNRTFFEQKKTLSECLSLTLPLTAIFKIRCPNIEGKSLYF